MNELLTEDYNFKQIDLILKGYKKSMLLSNINKDASENILRDILNNFTPTDIELYNILKLLKQKEITLDIELKIQNIINLYRKN